MKRFLFAIALVAASLNLSAQGNQCTGCAINSACDNPSARFPALCPATLPNGTQGVAYSEDITFYMPYTIDAQGFNGLQLEEVTVVGISGIPAGMFWTTSHYPTNYYDITSDVNTQRGCAKICGTPVLSGSYSPTVNVVVKVCGIPIVGCTTLAQTFVIPLTIDAAAGANPYFGFTPQSGCGSLDVTYNALLNVGTPQMTEYAWDFNNGNTSDLQNPPVQSYTTPGEYHPTLVTNVYDHVFNALSANITGGWWCGDIEELNCGNGNADLMFTLTHGSGSFNSSTIDNTINPSWNNLGVVLTNLTISVQFTEVDNGPPFGSSNDNGGSFAFVVPGPGTYNFSTTAVTSGGGGVNGNFTVTKRLFNSYSATDTVNVYTLPTVPTIASSTGSFTMCASDPLTLSVYGGNYQYEWYLNDTTTIAGATDSSYTVADPGDYPFVGNYKVKITDPATGCATISQNVQVTVNTPVSPLFSTSGIIFFNGVLRTTYSGPTFQWLLNGTPLVPSGQSQTLVPATNGTYRLVMTNAFGCSDTSNSITIANLSIGENPELEAFVSVYPNPSNGEFTLNMDVAGSSRLVITVLDVSGKTVHSENLGKFSGQLNKTFDLTQLSAGVYTLNVSVDQGTVRRKLIIR